MPVRTSRTRRTVLIGGASALAAALGAAALATPGLAAVLPPANPTSNLVLSRLGSPCLASGGAQPDSSGPCMAFDLAQIDAARQREGVGPLYLPSNYAQLTGAEQQFVVIDLERVDRGVPAITGLTSAVDALAQVGATTSTDPPFPSAGLRWGGSIWAEGYPATLEADFGWMYDDGLDSPNIACSVADPSGCWGHRDIILANPAGAPLIAGAATGFGNGAIQYAAELQQPSGAQPALHYTWADAVAAGAGRPNRPAGWPVPVRVGGADRVATAISISQTTFGPVGGSGRPAAAAIIARGDAFSDALAAAPLAAARQGPVLLTATDALDPRVGTELARILGPGAAVYLIGGEQALAPGIAQALTDSGYQVTRLAGPDRFATAVAIADALGDPSTVLEANGWSFADALAAGPAAAVKHGVVLLTDGAGLPDATASYLNAHPSTRYGIGGPAAQADSGSMSIAGADRYATAVAVAETFFPHPTAIGFATGVNYPDALAASAQLAVAGAPLLLLGTDSVPEPTAAYVAAHPSVLAVVYGGLTAVSSVVTSIL